MPRSGSELIQAILSQHPEISAGATSPLLEYIFGSAKNIDTEEARSQPLDDRYRYYNAFAKHGMIAYAKEFSKDKPSATSYLDKSRGWIYYYPLVKQIFGESPKIICMVRDFAEIVASMEKLHRQSIAVLGDPLENVTLGERIDTWCKTTPIGLAMRRILNSIDLKYENVLYVRYEDLCNNPINACNQICDHLELERHAFDFNNIIKQAAEEEMAFGMPKLHDVATKLEKPKTSARDLFGEDLVNNLKQFAANYQNAFGYK